MTYTRKTERRRCLGTGAAGAGATTRQAWGTRAASMRAGPAAGAAAAKIENTGEDAVEEESSPSEEAQQASASSWLTTLFELDSDASDGCIGQASVSEQHAMRASGDGSHPAQGARFPVTSARMRDNADDRIVKVNIDSKWHVTTKLSRELQGHWRYAV